MRLPQKHGRNVAKAIEVLLYVTKRVPDMYHALKVLYFADKEHLRKYGRLIYGEDFVALKHGPVPSMAYDIVKAARGDGFCHPRVEADKLFKVEGYSVTPMRDADTDQLSESEIECIDAAIQRYKDLSFDELEHASHNKAFLFCDENDFITIEDIARSLENNTGELLDYIHNG